MSWIIHTLLGVDVWLKLYIQPSVASESTDGEIIYMYKCFRENKAIWIYMEALSLHTGTPKLHWEDNTRCIVLVKVIRATSRVKQIYITVYFIEEQFKVFLFQNMWILVSCQQIFVPKHVRVQLWVGVLNGWLDYGSTHPVIMNTIKPRSYKIWSDLIILWGVYYVI